jgi:hypothetical protein
VRQEVDVDDPPHLLDSGCDAERRVVRDAGVGHEHLDWAEGSFRVDRESVDGVRISDVADHGTPMEPIGNLLRPFPVDIRNDDVRSALGKRLRQSASYPVPPAGHDRTSILQVHARPLRDSGTKI